jgi:outer membrane protein OmpA-like peptidoglycan-associated protein
MEVNEQKKKVSLEKQPAVEPVVTPALSIQGKKVSLAKQPAVKPVVVPIPLEPKRKISLTKQMRKMSTLVPMAPIVVPPPPAVSAPSVSKSASASAVSSVLPESSATIPRAEAISQNDVHPATDIDHKRKRATFARKIIGIMAGVIIIVILLLWRNSGSKKQITSTMASQTEFVQPSQEASLDPELSPTQEIVPVQEYLHQPKSISEPELASKQEFSKSSDLLALTYSTFYFMGDSNRFLPGLNYGERLSTIAQDMKNILEVKPDQIFVISGYSADIPGHDQGELELSIQRADRVRNSLVRLGVSQANMECVYRGGTSKWGDNISETTRSPNRIVTIELKD